MCGRVRPRLLLLLLATALTLLLKLRACPRRFMAVNIAFNNLSLVSLSLSLNQVIR